MTDEFSLDQFVMSPSDAEKPELIMLYGPYGGGKTWLGASASELDDLYPMLIIDNEGSTTGTVTGFPKGRIDVLRPKDQWPGNEYKATKKVLKDLMTKEHKYKTVQIDTLGAVFEWAKKEAAKQGLRGFDVWNFLHEELTADGGLIDQLKQANFLTILILHEKKEGGEDDTLPVADFQWQGQGKGRLGQFPDIIGYVTRDTNSAGVSTSTVSLTSTKRNNAKNRFGLPAKVVDPSMKKLYDMIETDSSESGN